MKYNRKLVKAIKIAAVNEEKTQTEIINRALKKEFIDIQEHRNKSKKPLSFMAGIFEGKKSFDSVKLRVGQK